MFEAERTGGLLPILILEKSVSGGEILPISIEFSLDAKKWSDIRSYPFLGRSSTDGFGEPRNAKCVD